MNLLGTFELGVEARPIRLRTRKAAALLAYLAVERRPHSRDVLVELLWPESDPERGRGMLRSTLAWVRRACAGPFTLPDPFVKHHQQVGLNPQLRVRLDLDLLTVALAEAERARPQAPGYLSLLARATTAYRGDFLAGLSLPDAPGFEDWALRQAEAWHQRQEVLLRQLAEGCLAAGDLDGAMCAAARWVSHAPLSEPAHQARIQIHLARGERAAAHEALERCRATLQVELGLEPTPETLALLRAELPPLVVRPQQTPPAPPRLPPAAYRPVPAA